MASNFMGTLNPTKSNEIPQGEGYLNQALEAV